MKTLIVNGSPKGEYSTTLHSCLYVAKKFPEHSFEVIHAAQKSALLYKDIKPLIQKMNEADLILFSYPVYTFIVPSQLHILIEKLKEEGCDFSGKYMSQITTSKHFFDVTAHRFMEENCRDLGMTCIPGLSADMEDLLKEKGRRQVLDFFRYLLWTAGTEEERNNRRVYDIALVTDLKEGDVALQNQINLFTEKSMDRVHIINLRSFSFKGGCLGCMNCASDGKCVYNDGFDEFLRTKIQGCDAIVYAFTVRDHSMGSLFKLYDDRQFCNGHRAVTEGTPLGYIVNGSLENEANLKMIMEARSDMGGNFMAGIAQSEESIAELARNIRYALENEYAPPRMFYGVGGMKIFRDLIYQMRGFMKADHKFFKEHDQYDFPHKRRGTILGMYAVGAMMSNEKIRKKASAQMKEGMISGYRKVLEDK